MVKKENIEQHDFDPYQPDSVPLFEAIYGKNLISLGGVAAIDNMFLDLNIRGLKALDLGFGLGGMAFYLAKNHQMRISGIEAPRPMTHDLLVDVVEILGAKVERLIIDKMVQNTFHGKLELKLKGEIQTKLVDTRPSDGIAIAVRAGAPIFVEDEVLEKVSIFKQE